MIKLRFAGIDTQNRLQSFFVPVEKTDFITLGNIGGNFEAWHKNYPNDSSVRVLDILVCYEIDEITIYLYNSMIERAYNYFG